MTMFVNLAVVLLGQDPAAIDYRPLVLDISKRRKTVVTGDVKQGAEPPAYEFKAKKGQRLKITLKDLQPDGLVTFYSIQFPSGAEFGGKGYDPFKGRLTETGTYVVRIHVNNMASNGDSGRFRLSLTRP